MKAMNLVDRSRVLRLFWRCAQQGRYGIVLQETACELRQKSRVLRAQSEAIRQEVVRQEVVRRKQRAFHENRHSPAKITSALTCFQNGPGTTEGSKYRIPLDCNGGIAYW